CGEPSPQSRTTNVMGSAESVQLTVAVTGSGAGPLAGDTTRVHCSGLPWAKAESESARQTARNTTDLRIMMMPGPGLLGCPSSFAVVVAAAFPLNLLRIQLCRPELSCNYTLPASGCKARWARGSRESASELG